MKKVLNLIGIFLLSIGIMSILNIGVYAYPSKINQKEYIDDYNKILNFMKDEIQSLHKFGDINADFLEQMVIQKEGIMYMSENILKYNNNRKVMERAKSTIRSEITSITGMVAIIEIMEENLKVNNEVEKEYLKNYYMIVDNMRSEIESIEIEDCVSNHYLKMMICFNEANIKLANNILKYTEDKTIKKIANNIYKDSNKQIKLSEKLINKG